MHFLKRNKDLIFLALLLVPAFYMDKAIISWVKEHCTYQDDTWYLPIDYLVKFSTHGATLIVFSLLVFLGTRWAGNSPKMNTLRISPLNMNRLNRAGMVVFTGLISAGIVVQGIKHLIGRARPRMTFDTLFIGPSMSADYDSFPSGHSTLVFCLACILSRCYPRYRALFYLFALLAGLDRIIGLSHFPSDVLAGAILGTVVGKIVSARTAGGCETAALRS